MVCVVVAVIVMICLLAWTVLVNALSLEFCASLLHMVRL